MTRHPDLGNSGVAVHQIESPCNLGDSDYCSPAGPPGRCANGSGWPRTRPAVGNRRPSGAGIIEPVDVFEGGLDRRIHAAGLERTADIFLADPSNATVLVLRCQWRATEDESPARTAGRQVAGATIAALATGNVVTESASSPRTWPLSPPNWTACAAPNPSPASTRKPFASSRWRRCAPFGTCPATSVSTRQSPIPLAVPRRCRPSTLRPARAHWTLADALPDARYVCGVIRRGRGGLVIAPLVLVTSQHIMVPVRNHPPERAQLPGPVLRLDPGHHRRLVPAHILRTEPGPPTRQRGKSFKGYSESMPSDGYTGCTSGNYARKHNPWVNFSNVPASSNLRSADSPTNLRQPAHGVDRRTEPVRHA